MPKVFFDHYYSFQELTDHLTAVQEQFPHLVRLQSIGKSQEGRDITLVTVTDSSTGSHDSKPAFWCDGNIHASEVSACTAVLVILEKLTQGFGSDSEITRLLQSRTMYLVPRLGPDGAELALQTPPKIVRSGTRKYPYQDEDPYGLEPKDLDGDGRILSMRIPDPNGAWVPYEKEPRIMRKRKPTEAGDNAYRVITEGEIHNYDGLQIRSQRRPEGLDFNRNFPSAWRIEQEQYGAGPYPTSEPEIRACVQAIVDRPNICGAITFHTFSGVHLRPPSRMADDDIPAEDLWVYKEFGTVGEEMTGYPAISNYHEFRYHPKEVITGVFDDWMFEHRGVFAWTTEIWSPQRQAGITDYKYIDWFRDHPVEDDLKLLEWADSQLDGKGYVDWYEFEHPQLGKVELGGWNSHYAFRNPPPKFLEAEVSPLADWAIWQALASPKLELRGVVIERLEDGLFKVRFAVQNTGYLPTNVSEHAKKKGLMRGVIGEIVPIDPCESWLVSGEIKQERGQLSGWSHCPSGDFGWSMQDTSDVAVFEWVVRAGAYRLVAFHDRAGRVEDELNLSG